jgi:hypothetical protein
MFASRLVSIVIGFVTLVTQWRVVTSAGYKKDYCGNNEFIPSEIYPHVHCGKDFYTWSQTSNKHDNMVTKDGFQCKTLDKVKDLIPNGDKMSLANRQAIMDSFNLAREGECSKLYPNKWILPADLGHHNFEKESIPETLEKVPEVLHDEH